MKLKLSLISLFLLITMASSHGTKVHIMEHPYPPVLLGGTSDSPIELSIYVDYTCSHCRQLQKFEKSLVSKTKGKVRIYLRNYPLCSNCNASLGNCYHEGSCEAARAVLAANYFGKAMDMIDLLWNRPSFPELSELMIYEYSEILGIDFNEFNQHYESPMVYHALKTDIKMADSAGLQGTPFVTIDNQAAPATFRDSVESAISILREALKDKGIIPEF